MIARLHPTPSVLAIAALLEEAGFEAWCVGGAIRDAFLGGDPLDWDLATPATPAEVRDLFGRRRTIPKGIEFGTVSVLDDEGIEHEITTFRHDVRTDGRHAEVEFGAVGRIRFARGSSFDLSPSLGRFRLVTMGRSFQWMDRPATLRSLETLVEPDGAVALFSSGHRDAPDTGWTAAYQALVRRYAADDSSHPRCRADGTLRHEAITVIERREVTVQQLVERALSRSSTAPDRLGDAVPRLAAEIEALLVPLAKDGTLPEVIATTALIARRPEARHP